MGLVLGLALVTASKKFYVETDERVTQVRECLRGANCGACGYAGCDAVAEAIVKGEARVDACPGNSTENIARIAAILGKEAIDQDPQVAYVRCAGTCEATKAKANYVGLQDCRAAVLSSLGFGSCDYGCIGLGSCVKVCPEGGISIENGIAHINASKCIGCGMCAKTRPKHVIEMHDRVTKVAVSCSNHDRGPRREEGLCSKLYRLRHLRQAVRAGRCDPGEQPGHRGPRKVRCLRQVRRKVPHQGHSFRTVKNRKATGPFGKSRPVAQKSTLPIKIGRALLLCPHQAQCQEQQANGEQQEHTQAHEDAHTGHGQGDGHQHHADELCQAPGHAQGQTHTLKEQPENKTNQKSERSAFLFLSSDGGRNVCLSKPTICGTSTAPFVGVAIV